MELEILEEDFKLNKPEDLRNFILLYNNDIIFYNNKKIKGYNLYTKKCIFEYKLKEKDQLIHNIKVSYNGKYLAIIIKKDKNLYQTKLIDLDINEIIQEFNLEDYNDLYFDLNSKYILFFKWVYELDIITEYFTLYNIKNNIIISKDFVNAIKLNSLTELKKFDENIFFHLNISIFSFYQNKFYYYINKFIGIYVKFYDYDKYIFIIYENKNTFKYSFNSLFNLSKDHYINNIIDNKISRQKLSVSMYHDNVFFVKNNNLYYYSKSNNKIYLVSTEDEEMELVNIINNLKDSVEYFTADGKFAITENYKIAKFITYIENPFNSKRLLKEWRNKNAILRNENGEELEVNKFLLLSYSKTLEDVIEDTQEDSNIFQLSTNLNLDNVNKMFLDLFTGVKNTYPELRNFFQVNI